MNKKVHVNLKDWFNIEENIAFSQEVEGLDIILYPSMPYLYIYKDKNMVLGAQDVSSYRSGAHTGAVSMDHLKEFNCKYVILNHNELRIENDEILLGKVQNAIDNNVKAIVCLNDISDRELNRIEYILSKSNNTSMISIAYEPHEELSIDIIKVHLEKIRNVIQKYDPESIIYGGSISKENIEAFENEISVDGYLISRHALNIDELKSILNSIN